MEFSADEKKQLLSLARETIAAELSGRATPKINSQNPRFLQPAGVFVSLHEHNVLRGCIGYVQAVKPLAEAVQEMAISAAFRDPRFAPLEKSEQSEINIEISILSPMLPIKPDQVVVGKHGLYIKSGLRSGLLLPQVPVEWNWSREEYLINLCRKAGLPEDSCQKGAELYAFTAEVFGE